MNIKALVPAIMQRSQQGGFALTRDEAEAVAGEMISIDGWPAKMSFLDDRLSRMSEQYWLNLFLTKQPDYRVTVLAA